MSFEKSQIKSMSTDSLCGSGITNQYSMDQIPNEEQKTISFLQKKCQDENYTGDELDEDESG